jgi:membrane fusion protein, copper/silver efflux system
MKTGIVGVLLVVALLGIAALVAVAERGDAHGQHNQAAEREILYWYDPMHPQHRFEEPGRSPFMDMDLVPRYADEETEPGQVVVASGVQQTMNIRTALVERGTLPRRIDTVGRVGYDDSRIVHLHPRVEGWIENVHVHAVGDPVRAGQELFTLYSPQLVNAQEEFLHALQRGEPTIVRSAREKLLALGVQREVVAEIERDRRVRQTLVWRAERDAVVSMLGIRHGMFVAPGEELMSLVDLEQLWVTAEVFDRQAAWLEAGQRAEVIASYRPGQRYQTTVAYVYPELDPVTRTVRVRLPVSNSDSGLRPGMWTTVRIFAPPHEDAVLIPREALIRTGESERVVLQDDEQRFRVREVVSGMEAAEQIEILEGLVPGEVVVVSGQFLIDSEAALRAGFGRLEGAEHQH